MKMNLIFENWKGFLNEVENRESFMELLNDTRAFFTMSDVDRIGVYPLSHYDTPTGVYSYPFNETHFKLLKGIKT